MFRALHYLNLTSHSLLSLLHLSPKGQPCWRHMGFPASSPSSSLRMLKSKESKPWKQRCRGGELGSPSNEVNTHLYTSYRLSSSNRPKSQDSRPNLSWFFGLLIIPQGHESTPDTSEDLGPRSIRTTNIIWNQTSLHAVRPLQGKSNHSKPIVYFDMHVLYLILSISSCHILQQSAPNHQKGTVLGQSSNQLAKAVLGDLALRPPVWARSDVLTSTKIPDRPEAPNAWTWRYSEFSCNATSKRAILFDLFLILLICQATKSRRPMPRSSRSLAGLNQHSKQDQRLEVLLGGHFGGPS